MLGRVQVCMHVFISLCMCFAANYWSGEKKGSSLTNALDTFLLSI